MKFAQILKKAQIPEWKKFYIDYRGLKKQIKIIKEAQEEGESADVHKNNQTDNDERQGRSRASKYGSTGYTPPLNANDPTSNTADNGSMPDVRLPEAVEEGDLHLAEGPASGQEGGADNPGENENPVKMTIEYSFPNASGSVTSLRPRIVKSRTDITFDRRSSALAKRSAITNIPKAGSSSRFFAGLRRPFGSRSIQGTSSIMSEDLPLSSILASLSPLERQFFEILDKELEKVNNFYDEQERNLMRRTAELRDQLHEFQDHRRLHKEYRNANNTPKWLMTVAPKPVVRFLTTSGAQVPARPRHPSEGADRQVDGSSGSQRPGSGIGAQGNSRRRSISDGNKERSRSVLSRHSSRSRLDARDRLNPEEYIDAKSRLKKAFLEHYRLLIYLGNYRSMNADGFIKALKKFEKNTKISVSTAYRREKIEGCAFAEANGYAIESMKKEVEQLFAAGFRDGDIKKARARLQTPTSTRTQYMSIFRTGIYLGSALPPLVDALHLSFQDETRASIPWDALLLVYATLAIPLVFSLLVGVNILVWSKSRINYPFIFDLDLRTSLDKREYFELPAFFLSSLGYAFWFTFRRIGEGTIAPTSWPLVWLVFAAIVLFNPLPFIYQSSRFWLIRKVGKLLVSGTKTVEFTDFWLGDQFCSLTFTLANMFFMACAYDHNWKNVWNTCSTSRNWGLQFVLASLPLVVRAVQSVKRYVDAFQEARRYKGSADERKVRPRVHLVNAGKYSISVIYLLFYYHWRHHNLAHDYSFVLFIMAATSYSIYTTSWDVLLDWDLVKHRSTESFLRKPEALVYSHSSVYYFAIISNIILRFAWVMYLPGGEFDFTLRTFVAATLEMLRRWQWNFFRLEAEQSGNTDKYRVTAEVPLPYLLDNSNGGSDDDDDDLDDGDGSSGKRSWTSKSRRSVRMSRLSHDSDDEERRA